MALPPGPPGAAPRRLPGRPAAAARLDLLGRPARRAGAVVPPRARAPRPRPPATPRCCRWTRPTTHPAPRWWSRPATGSSTSSCRRSTTWRTSPTLLGLVEDVVADAARPVVIEGYGPPPDPRVASLMVTPDPGVIEVNLQPTASWDELARVTELLYDLAPPGPARHREVRPRRPAHRHRRRQPPDPRRSRRPSDSPMLRRPDLLVSMLTFWQHHPSLSYLFSGRFVGPTSQAPRADEGRPRVALRAGDRLRRDRAARPATTASARPWVVDRALRHLLTDITGNTHRAEFCIDKLFSPDSARGRLGLLELRGFEMPPHAQMALVQALLVRALVARFAESPYAARWSAGAPSCTSASCSPTAPRPTSPRSSPTCTPTASPSSRSGSRRSSSSASPASAPSAIGGVELELRQAIEPWRVLGEEAAGAGTARYVDSSVERLQVKVSGPCRAATSSPATASPSRCAPTGRTGELVAGRALPGLAAALRAAPHHRRARPAGASTWSTCAPAAPSAAAPTTWCTPGAGPTTRPRSTPTRPRPGGPAGSRSVGTCRARSTSPPSRPRRVARRPPEYPHTLDLRRHVPRRAGAADVVTGRRTSGPIATLAGTPLRRAASAPTAIRAPGLGRRSRLDALGRRGLRARRRGRGRTACSRTTASPTTRCGDRDGDAPARRAGQHRLAARPAADGPRPRRVGRRIERGVEPAGRAARPCSPTSTARAGCSPPGCCHPSWCWRHRGFLRAAPGHPPAGRPPAGPRRHRPRPRRRRARGGHLPTAPRRRRALGYAMENRRVVSAAAARAYRDAELHRLTPFFRALRDALADLAAAPASRTPASSCSPRARSARPPSTTPTSPPSSASRWSSGADLADARRPGVDPRARRPPRAGRRVLRRVDDGWCDPLELRPDSELGVPGLVEACRRGTVVGPTRFGAGLVESPGLAAAPARAVPRRCSTSRCCCRRPRPGGAATPAGPRPRARPPRPARGPARRPARRHGGIYGPGLSAAELDRLRAGIEADPGAGSARSVLPLVDDADRRRASGSAPRPLTLRTLRAWPRGRRTPCMPGALGRVVPGHLTPPTGRARTGALSKDVWVLARRAEAVGGFWLARPEPAVGQPSPRACRWCRGPLENLFWLGRYTERAEGAIRLAAGRCDRLATDFPRHADPGRGRV